jgi:hypothetical protein
MRLDEVNVIARPASLRVELGARGAAARRTHDGDERDPQSRHYFDQAPLYARGV